MFAPVSSGSGQVAATSHVKGWPYQVAEPLMVRFSPA
jgi:hypothetical protein